MKKIEEYLKEKRKKGIDRMEKFKNMNETENENARNKNGTKTVSDWDT